MTLLNMKRIYTAVLSFLLISFLTGCEYERISLEEDCGGDEVNLVIESVEDTNCGEETGAINVSVQGSEEAYEFKLNDMDFVTTSSFDGLSAGNYKIVARKIETACVSAPKEVTINNANGIQLTLAEKDNSNCGENSGSIRVTQQNGVPPIEYRLNEGSFQELSEFTGLSSGDYTVVGRDANGCESEISGIEIMTGISFSENIKSIISTNCAVSGCHNGSQPPNFSQDENILENASRIKSRTGNGTMPPAGRPDLTNDEIQAIACWVDDGALDN